jgi:hypothetical protein
MLHWISTHANVFGDIALVWLLPVMLVMALVRVLRHDYRGSESYVPVVARPIERSEAARSERSRPAA